MFVSDKLITLCFEVVGWNLDSPLAVQCNAIFFFEVMLMTHFILALPVPYLHSTPHKPSSTIE